MAAAICRRASVMGLLAVSLVLCSTFMHAGWNLLLRYRRLEAAFIRRMLLVSVVVGFVPGVLSEALTQSLSLKAWVCVVGSGCCCGVYYLFLARAYGASDFTVVYPVARALPVLLVGAGDVARGRPLAAMGWLGLALVVSGCFLAPLRSFRDFSVSRYLNRTTLWMAVAAAGTVGYTLLDKAASEVVQPGPATAARYGCMFFAVSAAAYEVLLRASRTDRGGSTSVGWALPGIAACLNFGGYWLVLWAYQLVQHASSIIAFRQFSIVIGVVLGFLIYREQGLVVRLVGALLLTCGLVLIGLGPG